jgi:sacsin
MERDFKESSTVSEACEAARLFLSKVGIKTVRIPKFFLAAITKFSGSLNVTKANAASLRNALKNNPAVLDNQTRENKLLLLQFAISDENFEQMNGINLIPLADGSFGRFDSSLSHPVFVDSVEHPRVLLPLLKNWFVDQNVPEKIWSKLEKAAKKSSKNFDYKFFTIKFFSHQIHG